MELFIHIATEFYNNTFYRCVLSNTGYPIYAGYSGESVIAKNNAFIACGINSTTGWYAGAITSADYNFVSNTATGGVKSGFSETHGVNGGNPQLTAVFNDCSANTCNFHVGATSVVIDRATIISGYTTDQYGISRPQGAAWDIGVHEFPSGASGAKKPMPPVLAIH